MIRFRKTTNCSKITTSFLICSIFVFIATITSYPKTDDIVNRGWLIEEYPRVFEYFINVDGMENTKEWTNAVKASFDTWEDIADKITKFVYAGITKKTFTLNPTLEIQSFADSKHIITCLKNNWPNNWYKKNSKTGKYEPMVSMCIHSFVDDSGTQERFLVTSDIFLNGQDYHFRTKTPYRHYSKKTYDIQNTLTHEIGHFIGILFDLYKEEFKEATMFFVQSPGEQKKRTLEKKDVQILYDLYKEHFFILNISVDELIKKINKNSSLMLVP